MTDLDQANILALQVADRFDEWASCKIALGEFGLIQIGAEDARSTAKILRAYIKIARDLDKIMNLHKLRADKADETIAMTTELLKRLKTLTLPEIIKFWLSLRSPSHDRPSDAAATPFGLR